MPASDIFSLGILAYYALTGKFPIDPNVTQQQYDIALTEEQAPPIATVVSGLSTDLCEVIDTCLDRQPARRYLDGAELVKAIKSFRGEQ